MSGTSDDGYRRGRRGEEERRPRVGSVYRRLLLLIWTIGTVIALAVFGANVSGALAVVVVMHIFFSGIIWVDIRALRKQGVEWGLSRHLWFSSALVFPFVTLLYCWYVGRVVRRENERRGYDTEADGAEGTVEAADGDVDSNGSADAAFVEGERTDSATDASDTSDGGADAGETERTDS